MNSHVSFTQRISDIHFCDFLSAVPVPCQILACAIFVSVAVERVFGYIRTNYPTVGSSPFYDPVRSTFVTAAIGGVFGFIGRMNNPTAGIFPFHYAVWFALARQIQQFFLSLESRFENFLGDNKTDLEGELGLGDLVRYHSWKVIQLKNEALQMIDNFFSEMFEIRSYEKINKDNVAKASFLEMCRYRIWPVFKATILNIAAYSLARSWSNGMGFTLPNSMPLPLSIVMRIAIIQIVLVPAMYVQHQLMDNLDDGKDAALTALRARFRKLLPAL